jgi:hypothetical protein
VIGAVNRRHERIEEEDVLSAEQNYSQFAFEALLVENGITVEQFEDVLFEFAGADSVFPDSEGRSSVQLAGIAADKVDYVIERLKVMSFFGIEVGPERFLYVEGGPDSSRAEALARRYIRASGAEPRYAIHPAYRKYLEVQE